MHLGGADGDQLAALATRQHASILLEKALTRVVQNGNKIFVVAQVTNDFRDDSIDLIRQIDVIGKAVEDLKLAGESAGLERRDGLGNNIGIDIDGIEIFCARLQCP